MDKESVVTVRIEGDPALAAKHVGAAKSFFARIKDLRTKTGAGTCAQQMRVDQNTYFYAFTSGTINTVLISTKPAPVLAEPAPPMSVLPFLGGVVFLGLIKPIPIPPPPVGATQQQLHQFAPTPRTKQDLKLQMGKQNTPLLAVDPFHDELTSSAGAPFPFSQYTLLKPTMFTGAMKFVVQAVMSYGKQKVTLEPKDASPEYRARVSGAGFQVMYDYKFARSHGIIFGEDGTPWLVEISITNGVIAMPLGRINRTMSLAYYEQLGEQARSEWQAFIDLFGGFPTGEPFPDDVEAAVKAGTVLQLMKPDDEKIKEFFKCTGYSSAMGWAFNASGTEAHNTGYWLDRWEPGSSTTGAYIGYHYRIQFQIGPYHPENLSTQAGLNPDPIAEATAVIEKMNEGFILQYDQAGIGIKFHEPLMSPDVGGLNSLDIMLPLGPGSFLFADAFTPLHVFFIGDELKVVYWHNNADYEAFDEGFEGMPECTYGWSGVVRRERSGTTQVPRQFVSNDWDKRDQVSDSFSEMSFESLDMGYGKPGVTDRPDQPDHCDIVRGKLFYNTFTTITKTGEAHRSIVMVPANMREAYYIGHEIVIPQLHTHETAVWVGLSDPNTGVGFRKLFPQDMGPAAGCQKASKERIIISTRYDEALCSEYADNGPWLTMCQSVEQWLGPATPIPQPPSPIDKYEVFKSVEAKLFSATEVPEITLKITPAEFENRWMTPSPDPDSGNIQYLSMVTNTFGEDCTVYRPTFFEPAISTTAGATKTALTAEVTFVGVVS